MIGQVITRFLHNLADLYCAMSTEFVGEHESAWYLVSRKNLASTTGSRTESASH
jgi:hypothetical protein